MKTRTAVVGGGIVGMTLALRLAQAGHDVTLFESAPRLGGLADAWTIDSVTWDRHYHVTLYSDLATRALATELGLDDYEWVTTRTGFYTDGALYSMSNAVEFLRFPPLGLLDKLRLAATIVYASRITDGRRLEAIPVEAWLRRLSGARVTEKIWLPLLRAKLGSHVANASAAFLWAIIARMYAARRSGLKTERFGYLHGGYARFVNRFAERLAACGVTIRTSARVETIDDGGTTVRTRDADGTLRSDSVDRTVVTVAAPLALRMLPNLDARETATLGAVSYLGIVCASVVLRRPLATYYVTNVTDPQPFSAVIEMTALVDPATFGGRHLVYLPKYVAADDAVFDADDATIEASFVEALRRMYPHLAADDVLAFRVSRVRYVAPVTTLDYSKLVLPFATSIAHVDLVNSTQIVNGTLNVNESIALAERAAREILARPDAVPVGAA